MKNQSMALGIDLGSLTTKVGFWSQKKPNIIYNSDTGSASFYSYITFTQENQRLFDVPATGYSTRFPTKTIYNIINLLGRDPNSSELQQIIDGLPFFIEKNEKGHLVIRVEFLGKLWSFYPQQIAASLIALMKSNAQKLTNGVFTHLVMPTPTFFSTDQRQAVIAAAKIAGFTNIRLISGPCATAIVYQMDKKPLQVKKLLIVDIGASKIDVSIIDIDDGVIQVKATSGSNSFGGIMLDKILQQYCRNQFEKINGISLNGNRRALKRLSSQCQKIKIILSTAQSAYLQIDCLADGIDLSLQIKRSLFQQLIEKEFQKILLHINKAIKMENIQISQIDDIVLTGGTCKIPKVQKVISQHLKGRNINLYDNQPIAKGITIYSALLKGQVSEQLERMLAVQMYSNRIYIEDQQKNKHQIKDYDLKGQLTIPFAKKFEAERKNDTQTEIRLKIFQLADNERQISLRNLCISNLPAGKNKVTIVVQMAEDGILQVCLDKQQLKEQIKLEVERVAKFWSPEEIAKARHNQQMFQKQIKDYKKNAYNAKTTK